MNQNVSIHPMDEHNQKLVDNTHPNDWTNPEPKGIYNLVVIGAGTAGLVTAAGAAGLGAKVALVERHLMGGDCLNVGCVPSKCLIRSGHAMADVMDAKQFGVHVPDGTSVDFAEVMRRMRKIRSDIAPHDSVERFTKLGIDVFLGDGKFNSDGTVEVGGKKLKYKKAVICTGARAFVPPIEGLQDAGYVTNDTVFELTELPKRFMVIGGGPIGCELAQSFCNFGSDVHIIERAAQFLIREDPDAAVILKNTFEQQGIHIHLNTEVNKITKTGSGKFVELECNGKTETIEVDEILVGAGRAPNVNGLNLEAVGVEYDERKGVQVNDNLQTTNPKIFAAGDVCMSAKFTHAADFAARTVIQNALFPNPIKSKRGKLSSLIIPWCTYTNPEIAHVGIYEKDAKEKGIEIDTYVKQMSDVDRAMAEGDTKGFVKIHTEKGSDKILGATIVAKHAGEMINEITLAMKYGIGLGKIAYVIHSYPTQAEAIRHLGEAYNRTKLTPFVKKLFKWWLS